MIRLDNQKIEYKKRGVLSKQNDKYRVTLKGYLDPKKYILSFKCNPYKTEFYTFDYLNVALKQYVNLVNAYIYDAKMDKMI